MIRTSQDADVEITYDRQVAIVEIQRPPHNFFDSCLVGRLADIFEELDTNPACRAIVLASQGRSFCAGAYLGNGQVEESVVSTVGAQAAGGNIEQLYRDAVRIFRCKKPIIAAIQGPAIGGGLGLALAADFRVVCPEARFAANFVKLGSHPGFGLTVTLPDVVGPQMASLMFLTGRRIRGEDAVKLGLADQLVSRGRLRGAATDLAIEITHNAPLAVLATRATLRGNLGDRVAAATEKELREQFRLRKTDDYREGVRAVADRRRGEFAGR